MEVNKNEENEEYNPSPQTIRNTLKAAAKLVEKEEQLDTQAALNLAAESFALEYGINNNNTNNNTNNDNNNNNSTSNNNNNNSNNSKSNNGITPKNNRRQSVNEDAIMLMDSIKENKSIIMPKPSSPIDIETAVDQLVSNIEIQQAAATTTTPKPSASVTFSLPEKKSIKPFSVSHSLESKRKQQQQQQNRYSSSGKIEYKSITTELSDISKLLQDANDKKWIENLSRTSFQSTNQEILFRTMHKVKPNNSNSNKSNLSSSKKISANELNRITTEESLKEFQNKWKKGLLNSQENNYSKYDDIKNCYFHPKINKNDNLETNNNDDEEGGSKLSNFIERQQAYDRNRRMEHELKKNKEDYSYKIDKKFCIRCGGKQSYDEIKEKRKLCPNCNIKYRNKLSWTENTEKTFYDRQNKYYKQYNENKTKIQHELEEFSKGSLDENGQQKWTKKLEKEFFDRQNEFKEKTNQKLLIIENEIYGNNRTINYDDRSIKSDTRSINSRYNNDYKNIRRSLDDETYYQWLENEEKQQKNQNKKDTENMIKRSLSANKMIRKNNNEKKIIHNENEYLFQYKR